MPRSRSQWSRTKPRKVLKKIDHPLIIRQRKEIDLDRMTGDNIGNQRIDIGDRGWLKKVESIKHLPVLLSKKGPVGKETQYVLGYFTGTHFIMTNRMRDITKHVLLQKLKRRQKVRKIPLNKLAKDFYKAFTLEIPIGRSASKADKKPRKNL